ncbi:MAG: hypothetical protein IT441_09860, partial [Phycisphaeraceae bacterium]|nr:hypothetical protein [Phycisphaeraceae bacterium]
MVSFKRIALCIVSVGLLTAPKISASVLSTSFLQTNFNQGASSVADSEWGLLDLEFSGTGGLQFVNLVVDGQWVIRNSPLISSEGLGMPHQAGLIFNLGNDRGVNVSSLSYTLDVGPSILVSAPADVPITAPVGDVNVTVGGRGGALGVIAEAVGAIIGAIPIDWAFNSGMINQDIGVDECVPGAFSNSLKWLKPRKGLSNLPDDKITVDALKGPTNWSPPQVTPPELDENGDPIPGTGGEPIPGTGGTPVDGSDWQGKRDAVDDYGVTTRAFTIAQIDQVMEEIEDGQDVELLAPHHGAVVTGIVKFLDGTYAIRVTHDTEQGVAGGTRNQYIIYDPSTG